MRLKSIVLSAMTASVILTGCGGSAGVAETEAGKPTISEESLGLRKVDLYSEEKAVGDKTSYATAQAGESKKIERAFENAPPMIPHDVSDYLPITANNNACTGCHMPDVAPSMNATPIPKSHFANFRPEHKLDHGTFKKSVDNMKNEVVVKDLKDQLYMGRFNCSQCHAPQSSGQLVENTFQPDFRSDGAKERSNLLDSLNEGVK